MFNLQTETVLIDINIDDFIRLLILIIQIKERKYYVKYLTLLLYVNAIPVIISPTEILAITPPFYASLILIILSLLEQTIYVPVESKHNL